MLRHHALFPSQLPGVETLQGWTEAVCGRRQSLYQRPPWKTAWSRVACRPVHLLIPLKQWEINYWVWTTYNYYISYCTLLKVKTKIATYVEFIYKKRVIYIRFNNSSWKKIMAIYIFIELFPNFIFMPVSQFLLDWSFHYIPALRISGS